MADAQHATTSPETLNASGMAASFTVNDLRRSIHFYTAGLGFEIENQTEGDDAIRFAMLKAGNAHIGLAQDDFARGRDRVKGVGMRMFIETAQDIHALADRAKAAGITLDADPAPLPWGPIGFAVTDPDGFKLTIASER